MEIKSASLVEDFQRYFSLEQATTPAQLHNVYKVRYRVYCEEFHYESAESCPDKLESDEFDATSRHCLVMHRASGMPAGCARLVMPDEQRLMPMEKFCSNVIDQELIRDFDGRRHLVCEFSRLGVDGAFRRRPGEGESRFGEIAALDFSQREQRTFPLIAMGTILSALAMSELIGRPHCFAMMEPFLPRLLRRSGLIAKPAGTETEYHGTRAPYYWESHEGVSTLSEELKELYLAIRADFAASGALRSSSAVSRRSGAFFETAPVAQLSGPQLAF